jgi:RimJ/RimL family protein N-acetyltransferase
VLRPTVPTDIDRAFAIRSNWEVARNLSRASFPPDRRVMEDWFGTHASEWQAGTAYRFAICRNGEVIGIIDIGEIDGATGELGYWLDEAAWGQGYGTEAARAVIDFAFGPADLRTVIAGHAADNHASGAILRRLGFQPTGQREVASRSRGETILQLRYRLDRPS